MIDEVVMTDWWEEAGWSYPRIVFLTEEQAKQLSGLPANMPSGKCHPGIRDAMGHIQCLYSQVGEHLMMEPTSGYGEQMDAHFM